MAAPGSGSPEGLRLCERRKQSVYHPCDPVRLDRAAADPFGEVRPHDAIEEHLHIEVLTDLPAGDVLVQNVRQHTPVLHQQRTHQFREAEERDRQALNTADATLERIDTGAQKLVGKGTAITAEQAHRRDLAPEQTVVETMPREQWRAEKDTARPEAKERNNRAMLLTRQREQSDQQKHRGRGIER